VIARESEWKATQADLKARGFELEAREEIKLTKMSKSKLLN